MSGFSILVVVTVVYAAVLVAALAATLITIAAYLWRISAMLLRVQHALAEVRERTAPLHQDLDGVSRLTEDHVEQFEQATIALERAAGVPNEADVMAEAAANL